MPKFSKHHYEAIADALWQVYNDPEVISIRQIDRVLDEFVDIFKQDNPLFKEEKFRARAKNFQ